jgi:hypothetical protein
MGVLTVTQRPLLLLLLIAAVVNDDALGAGAIAPNVVVLLMDE